VLTEAAVYGKIDRLSGLKENVIIGRLIPAYCPVSEEAPQLTTGEEQLATGEEQLATGEEKLTAGEEKLATGEEKLTTSEEGKEE
jgi:uncharacterized phage infection (PIP) family protein YhgE